MVVPRKLRYCATGKDLLEAAEPEAQEVLGSRRGDLDVKHDVVVEVRADKEEKNATKQSNH